VQNNQPEISEGENSLATIIFNFLYFSNKEQQNSYQIEKWLYICMPTKNTNKYNL